METTPTNSPPSVINSVEPISSKRRNGKIAHLSKDLRDLINNMLLDGATYSAVIEKLKEHDVDLNHENVSNWYNGGHRDWLKQRENAEVFGLEMEHVEDLLSKTKADEIPDLVLKLAAARFCSYLKDLAPDRLHATTEEDPTNLVRLLSLLPKFSREALRTRKYRRSVQREEATDPGSPEAREKARSDFLDSMDQLFGIKPPKRKAPINDQDPTTKDTRDGNAN